MKNLVENLNSELNKSGIVIIAIEFEEGYGEKRAIFKSSNGKFLFDRNGLKIWVKANARANTMAKKIIIEIDLNPDQKNEEEMTEYHKQKWEQACEERERIQKANQQYDIERAAKKAEREEKIASLKSQGWKECETKIGIGKICGDLFDATKYQCCYKCAISKHYTRVSRHMDDESAMINTKDKFKI